MSDIDPPIERAVLRRTMLVVLIFCAYAAIVAFAPTRSSGGAHTPRLMSTADGISPNAWRGAGCHFCHSLYGLGGHTGPDLTNVVSRASPEYIRAVVRNGLPGMPAYAEIGEDELDGIIAYLTGVDRTATYPPASLTEGVFGGE